jgi:RNA ligase (TIGR02306 family)
MEDHKAEVVELEIFEHEGADKLELAQPMGTDWISVVGKGQFVTGDLAIYVPIDSIVPCEFVEKYLSNSKIKLEKNRIRSVKIRKVISQGLCVPASSHHQLGQDVTEELGIRNYEPQTPKYQSQGQARIPKKKKKFVAYVDAQFPKYTKIRNHKNFKGAIKEGTEVVILEKLHGTNHRSGRLYVGGFKKPWYKKLWDKLLKKDEKWRFTVGSHNVTKWHEDKLYWRAAKLSHLHELEETWNGYIFYGEICGHGIQELSYGIPPGDIRLFIFDILFQNEHGQANYLPWCEVQEICKRLNLETPPELYVGPWNDDLVKLADGQSRVKLAKHHREGFVVKPLAEAWHPSIGRLILKRISDIYLLGKKRTDFH